MSFEPAVPLREPPAPSGPPVLPSRPPVRWEGKWQPLNLAASEYAAPPTPPADELHGLIYLGKRHIVSAPTESVKTLVLWAILLDGLRAGIRVACVDFEMGPTATRRMLVDLGATDDEVAQVTYLEPTTEPTEADIEALAAEADVVMIDAAAGAYAISGLDDNKRQDAEQMAAKWITPLWQRGKATIVPDHVTKATEGRGKYAIGSERKVGQTDVHLGIEVVGSPLTRGGSALVKIHVHKDRPGFLSRPVAAEINLASDPDTHAITWKLSEAPTAAEPFRPTVLMEKVSRYIEGKPASRAAIKDGVAGRNEWIIKAITALIEDGYADETVPGTKGTSIRSTKPFRQDTANVPASFPPFPGNGSPDRSPVPTPYRGNGNGNDGQLTPEEELHYEAIALEMAEASS